MQSVGQCWQSVGQCWEVLSSVGNVGSAVELRRESSTLGTESVKHKKSDSILSTSAPTGNHGKTFYLLLTCKVVIL